MKLFLFTLAFLLFASPSANAAVCSGTSGNNIIVCTNQDDSVYGLGGNDSLSGLGGNDTMFGMRGHDAISGGPGADRIYGGCASSCLPGENFLQGDAGKDYLFGGNNSFDFIKGGDGVDRCTADRGLDTVRGCEIVRWV